MRPDIHNKDLLVLEILALAINRFVNSIRLSLGNMLAKRRIWYRHATVLNGYKILANVDGRRYSCLIIDPMHRIEYVPNKPVKPHMFDGPLSVFNNYEDAEEFFVNKSKSYESRIMGHWEIWECEYVESKRADLWYFDFLPLDYSGDDTGQAFLWDRECRSDLPHGTSLADKVRILRMVKEQESKEEESEESRASRKIGSLVLALLEERRGARHSAKEISDELRINAPALENIQVIKALVRLVQEGSLTRVQEDDREIRYSKKV